MKRDTREFFYEPDPSEVTTEEIEVAPTSKQTRALTTKGGDVAQRPSNRPRRIDDNDRLQWPTRTKQDLPDGRSIVNVTWYCENCGVMVRFNEFDLRTYVVIDDERKTPQEAVKDQRELDDPVILEVQHRMHGLKCIATTAAVEAGLRHVGAQNKFHPVREYLGGLKWDGTPRLEKLLPHYVGAENSPLNRAFGKAWMISAVRRIKQPGCKVDAVLTLQSPQGTGKSTFFRILASDAWFNDSLEIGGGAKDVIENATGAWIIELAELSKMGKREVEEVKKFISIQSDRARTAYARVAKEVPRQFVLGASVNREEFLIDDTGNRRFWVVPVARTREEELARDRDQLWAEAVHLEAQGEPHNIPEKLRPAAEEIAERHTISDPIAEAVILELGRLPDENAVILASDLYKAIGAQDVTRQGGQFGRSVAAGARRAGWQNKLMRPPGHKGKGSVRCYQAPLTLPHPTLHTFSNSGEWRAIKARPM
ncbi:MAG: hypothetical protein F9K29_03655 [Hyphomicrobiaceae bacterium]|nr:MAG: hypothetical protein F9K29_03655 [Hyphomicrobiaceae bacterium]